MISAIITTYNDESYLESYIKNLSFADELIIIDAYSTDKTVEIAEKYNIIVIQREFNGFESLLKLGIHQATNNWILCSKVDEHVSNALTKEIKYVVNSSSDLSVYKIKRTFTFMGKPLKYSGFNNNSSIRLFNKTDFDGDSLEFLKNKSLLLTQKTEKLYLNFDSYNEHITNGAKLKADYLYSKRKRPNAYHFFIKPFLRFTNQYVLKLGILDGKEGFVLSYLKAFKVFKTYLFLWLKYRNIE